LAILGLITWPVFFMLFLLVYTFSVMISLIAVYIDQETYRQYRSPRYQWKLLLCALTEPFIFHPFVVYQAIKGNFQYLRGSQSWGTMTRKGLSK
jgi:poly-beta-1,6-N-acetyl-D-glucosamine synthase